MFVVNILDEDPLNLEIALELEGVVLPPEGECFFVVSRPKPGDALEHPAFDCTEKEIGVGIVAQFPLPKLFYFVLVLGSGCPDAVFYCLGRPYITLWTLSSLALLMTIPMVLLLCGY